MNTYTIYCSPEQTKKALKLGAPIEYASNYNAYLPHEMIDFVGESGKMECAQFVIPTAEEMIGWLEENGILDIVISRRMSPKTYGYTVWFSENTFVQEKHSFTSRREATLVAIDAALEYLTQNKK